MSNKEKKFQVGNEEITLKMKERLSLPEVLTFVNNVASGCVGEDVYYPELASFLMKKNTLLFYGGVEVNGELEAQYEFISNAPKEVWVFLHNEIDSNQHQKICDAIEKKIAYLMQRFASKSKCDALFDVMIRFVEKLEKNCDFDELRKMLSDLSSVQIDREAMRQAVPNKQNVVPMPKKQGGNE